MNEVLYDITSPLVGVGESALSDPSDVNIQQWKSQLFSFNIYYVFKVSNEHIEATLGRMLFFLLRYVLI
jgi:hypothetical protein